MEKICENCKWYFGENREQSEKRKAQAGYFEFTSGSVEGNQKIATGACRKYAMPFKASYDDFCGEFEPKKKIE